MKKFLKFALKSQRKILLIILVLAILQVICQIEIVALFASALKNVEAKNAALLFYNGMLMLAYTIISMIIIYGVSFLATKVSSNVAYNTRKKMFNILMRIPDEEINKFKITGLITRTTRGIYSEQRFLMLMLKHSIIIPIVFVGIVIEIAFIDKIFAVLFAASIIIMSAILIFKLKQVTAIYFKAKKTYGKLNLLFMSKLTNLSDNLPFKKQESMDEFEKACAESYDKNIKYLLSQYYIGPVSLLVLDVVIVVLMAFTYMGQPFAFESESVVAFVVIIQYILYFLSTVTAVQGIIDIWPRSYATSIRIEEVLNLEDKVKTENDNVNPKRIEITEYDLGKNEKSILVDRTKIFKKFNKILTQHRDRLIVSMILLAVSTLSIAYAPIVAGKIIDFMEFNPVAFYNNGLLTSIALLFALYTLGYLLKLPSRRFMIFVGEKITYNLRMALFEKLETIDSKFIQHNSKGHILSRLNNDIMNIKDFIELHISEFIAQNLCILLVYILILATDWRLSLIYLITAPMYVICFYYSDVKSKNLYEDHYKHLGRMMSYLERSLKDRSPFHEKEFEKINKTVTYHFYKSRNITNFVMPITTFLTNIRDISVYIVGIYFLMTNEIQLGSLLAVIIYGHLLTRPLKKVSVSLIFLETSFSIIKRIFEIIEFKDNE